MSSALNRAPSRSRRIRGGCEYYRTSDGTTVVTLTYADELIVNYVYGTNPIYDEPADDPDNDPATPDPNTPGP